MNTFLQQFPEYAKDIKLNLSSVLKAQAGLSEEQVALIAYAASMAVKNTDLTEAVFTHFQAELSETHQYAAKAATSIMAMNNIYYRFVHLVSDNDYMTMPAGLRMNVMANPGVDKLDFELMSLAVSSINGCGMCIDSHVKQLQKGDVSKQIIAHSIKIAAVLHAAAQVLEIESETVPA